MRALPTALAFAFLAASGVARAQTGSSEPIKITFAAIQGCPNEQAFTNEVKARTARARIAGPNEPARVFRVKIDQRGGKRHGTLRIEDTSGQTDVREVEAPKCAEVVSALALISALAIDPHASTAAISTLPGAPGAILGSEQQLNAPVRIEIKKPWFAGLDARGSIAARHVDTFTSWQDLLPSPLPVIPSPPVEPKVAVRFSLGAHVGALSAFAPNVTGVLSAFVDLRVNELGPFTPSFRLEVLDSFSSEVLAPTGSATFHLIAGRFQACPFRLELLDDRLEGTACTGLTAGVVDAQGNILDQLAGAGTGVSGTSPWVDVPLLARATLLPLDWLALELEGGAVIPIAQPTFLLGRDAVHVVPSAGGTVSFGAAVRF